MTRNIVRKIALYLFVVRVCFVIFKIKKLFCYLHLLKLNKRGRGLCFLVPLVALLGFNRIKVLSVYTVRDIQEVNCCTEYESYGMTSSLLSQPSDKPSMVVGHAYMAVDVDTGTLEQGGK